MYFRLFTNCIIVEGVTNDAIYDLHTGDFLQINKRISNLLQEDLKNLTIQETKEKHPDWQEGLEAYMDYLMEHDFAFKTSEPHKFPNLSLAYESPFQIDNSIIHINPDLDVSIAIRQIMEMDAQGFQLIMDNPSVDELQKYANIFISSRVRRVEFLIRNSDFTLETLRLIEDDLRFVYRVFNADADYIEKLKSQDLTNREEFHYLFKKEALDFMEKESYSVDNFSIGLSQFIEAQTRNIGLNKKVCIDREGNIKNYISHDTIFGNIKTHEIFDVVSSEGFQKKWFIDNSQIQKCKGCIYRMMCFSCSDIVEREGLLYKMDDCNYDPISDQWAE